MTLSPRLRVLVVTRCFPNRAEPLACAFARQQIGALSRLAEVEVVAPIPAVPGAWVLGDRARVGRLCGVPRHDHVASVPVAHPRAAFVPGGGRVPGIAALNVPLYTASIATSILARRDWADVVLGTFLCPDGVAAAALGALLGKPVVLKAHGTDLDVVATWPSVRPMIRAALKGARATVGVSARMVEALIALGARGDRARVVPNGVDRGLFHPRDRAASRRAMGLPDRGRIVLFVGDVIRDKGAGELVRAWAEVRRAGATPVHLVMVGEGSLARELRAFADAQGEPDRGRLILAGTRPLGDVAAHLGACDLLALPSLHEGTPNVVLEALASGRPVVASRVGGIPEAVPDGRAGLLVTPGDTLSLSRALACALARTWDEAAIVEAAPPSWEASAARLHEVLREASRGDRVWSSGF